MLTAGQRGDSPQFIPVLRGIRVPRAAGGRPRTRPDRVLADKAYTSKANREHLRRRGIRRRSRARSIRTRIARPRGPRAAGHRPSTPRTTSNAMRWSAVSTGSSVTVGWLLGTTNLPCVTRPPCMSQRSTNGSDRLRYRP
ncbi:transposase [Umezawaea tangerina]|uniref:transposase n=1 Tax=Umezawaea tangerina TaxID=84725 RepID=UPI003CCB7D6B